MANSVQGQTISIHTDSLVGNAHLLRIPTSERSTKVDNVDRYRLLVAKSIHRPEYPGESRLKRLTPGKHRHNRSIPVIA